MSASASTIETTMSTIFVVSRGAGELGSVEESTIPR